MGGIGGMLGGVVSGVSDAAGIGRAPIENPTNAGQVNTAYGGVQNSLASQQALLQALQQQQGIQNQSNVFGQLQGIANGTGPNPAQAMLNQSTGANVANQAALMAGQRGASSNAGLIARQAAQQGSQIQQQAAGQAATLQAQQGLGAIGQMGAIANNQVANQIGQTNTGAAGQLAEQQNLLGTAGQYNQQLVGQQAGLNQTRGQIAGGLLGGLGAIGAAAAAPAAGGAGAGGAGAAVGAAALAHGGAVPSTGPKSKFGQHCASGGKVSAVVSPGEVYVSPEKAEAVKNGENAFSVGKKIPGKPEVGGAKDSYKNDKVKTKLEPGGVVIPRSITMGKDPINESAKFVAAVLAKKRFSK